MSRRERIGTPVLLSDAEMEKMVDVFNNSYGQKKAKKDMDV